MFLLRVVSIWALMHTAYPAPQWPNSRFGRTPLQLNESNSTFTESIAGKQEQSTNQQKTFLPRVILFQDLQPPTFGILNKLPYLTLQPPLFALPQEIADDILGPLPGPASNSVELEKRSKIYTQENNSNESEETTVVPNVVNDAQLETTVSLDNNIVSARTESTENNTSETSNGDSTTSLDLSSETPTTEINDISSAVIASRQGKESEGTTTITKIINEIQATFNDETTNESLNLQSSTQNEFDDAKTTFTSVLQYSTSNDVNTQQINIEQLNSTLQYSSDNPTTEVPPSDQNTERITETTANKGELIKSRYGLPESTPAEELITIITTTANEEPNIQSTAEDTLISDAPTTKSNSGEIEPIDSIETTSLAATTQTESEALINESNTKRTEVTKINSRFGVDETTITNGVLNADFVDVLSTERDLNQIALTELDNSKYTTVKAEETTSLITEDVGKFNTTEVQELPTSQISLKSRYDIAPPIWGASKETVTTSGVTCEDDYVTDEPSVSKEDLELSNRVSETEEVTKGKESEQPNEITVSSNLETFSENPTTTQVITSDGNNKPITELIDTISSPYGVSEELVILTTTASNDEVATKSIVEEVQTLKPSPTTSPIEEASTNEPVTEQKLQSRINIEEEEEVTVNKEKVSEARLPPLENIKSNVSVSYGLNYKPDSNDIIYTISTTVKSILTHKSGEDGNVTSEVNAVINATSVLQDQNNTPGFSTAVVGNVSSASQGFETKTAEEPDGGFGIEINKTNVAPELNIRLLPPFASLPNGIHGRLSDTKLSATIAPNVFDINKGSNGSGQNTFTIPSNAEFTIKLDKSRTEPSTISLRLNKTEERQNLLRSSFSDSGSIKGNFDSKSGSIRGNLGRSTVPSSSQFAIRVDKPIGAEPNFSVRLNNNDRQNGFLRSGSITENLGGSTSGDHVSFIAPSSSPSTNLPTNDAQFAININKNKGAPNLSVQFSSLPNVNLLSRQNVPQDKFGSTFASPTGYDFQEQVNFNSVINIGNGTPKSAKVNDDNGETQSSQPNGNNSDKPSKFRSVTIDTSVANDPSELLKNYNNKNGQRLQTTDPSILSPSSGKYVQAKYVGQTSVDSDAQSGISTVDESSVNDSFKGKFGFDLSFLNRGINSKSSPDSGFLNQRKASLDPPTTETPQTHFNKPFRPSTFGSTSKSGTFGVSLGPYRDTLIKHTGKGWSLRTYDKLILHTGLSGQYL